MKIAMYYPWVYLKGGAERLLLETLTRSRHEWTLFTNHYDPEATFAEIGHLPVHQLRRVDVRRDLSRVAAAGWTIARQRIDDRGHDGALVVSEGLGNLMAGHFSVPTSCLCLTPMKVAYEDVTRDHFFEARGTSYRTALAGYRAVDRRTWRHYRRIIAISYEVRRRLVENGLAHPDRIDVAHPGVDLVRFDVGGDRRPYFLLPGRIMWQKRIDIGLEAWRWFKPHPDDSPFRLVVAGMVDAKSQAYLDQLRSSVAWRHDVEFVTGPTDGELVELYRHSRAILFTAPNEDFGLVVLEAMACGKPVVAPLRGGPTETVVHGDTGLLVEHHPCDLARALGAMAALDDDQLDRMGRLARARAEEFSWDAFVARLDDLLADTTVGARMLTGASR